MTSQAMTPQEWEEHVRSEADRRCKEKHPDIYDAEICVGPGSKDGFGPPCDKCLAKTRAELEQKRRKMHGTEVPREKAERRIEGE